MRNNPREIALLLMAIVGIMVWSNLQPAWAGDNVADGKMLDRTFKVPPGFGPKQPSQDEIQKGNFDGMKSYLENEGIIFPVGASATFRPEDSVLTVHNTMENIQWVEVLIADAWKDSQSGKGARKDKKGTFILGSIRSEDGSPISSSVLKTIALKGEDGKEHKEVRIAVMPEGNKMSFRFMGVEKGISVRVTVEASGYAAWNSAFFKVIPPMAPVDVVLQPVGKDRQ